MCLLWPVLTFLPLPNPFPHCTHALRLVILQMKYNPYCKLPLSQKSLHLAPPFSFGKEAKCYFAESQWQFLVRAPRTFLAKCCKINGGPLNFSGLRWTGERENKHMPTRKWANGRMQGSAICCYRWPRS